MARFRKVARTTRRVEKAMRMVDIVLQRSFHFDHVEWEHRDISSTGEYSDDPVTDLHGFCRTLHDEVTIQGKLSIGHKIKAHVTFLGYHHETINVIDGGIDDHSQPLQIEEIRFNLTTKTGKEVEKKCYVDTSFFSEVGEDETRWFIR